MSVTGWFTRRRERKNAIGIFSRSDEPARSRLLTAPENNEATSIDIVEGIPEEIMTPLTETQKVRLTINGFTDPPANKPARVTAPEWASSNPAVVTVTPIPSSLSAWASSVPGQSGVSTITGTAKSAGGKSISGTFDIQVNPLEATVITIVAGTPEEQ